MWRGWQCAGAVPKIERLSATDLIGTSSTRVSEVFALGDGTIWVRHQYSASGAGFGSGPWQHVARPGGVRELRDIHTFSRADRRPQLLALSESAVFIRGRTTDATYSPFASWERVGALEHGQRLCGGYAEDGHIEVYVVDEQGALSVAKRANTVDGSDSLFSAFEPVFLPGAGAKIAEIECVTNSGLPTIVLTTDKKLYLSKPNDGWVEIPRPPSQTLVDVIAAQSINDVPVLYMVDLVPQLWVGTNFGPSVSCTSVDLQNP